MKTILILIGAISFFIAPWVALYGAKQIKNSKNESTKRKYLLLMFASCIMVTCGFISIMFILRMFTS